MNHVENVQQLTLVFMDALDLGIEQSVRVENNTGIAFHVISKSPLVAKSNFAPLGSKLGVIDVILQLCQCVQIR